MTFRHLAAPTVLIALSLLAGCGNGDGESAARDEVPTAENSTRDEVTSEVVACPQKFVGSTSPEIWPETEWKRIAFSGGYVAYAAPLGDHPDYQEVRLGAIDDVDPLSLPLQGVEDIYVVAAPDGFAIAYDTEAQDGIDVAASGSFVRRVDFEGETVWETKVGGRGEVNVDSDTVTLDLDEGKTYLSWQTGDPVGAPESVKRDDAVVYHDTDFLSVPDSAYAYKLGGVRADGWTVELTGYPDPNVTLSGTSDSGESWTVDVPETTESLVSCGDMAYALVNESTLSVIDPATGDQVSAFPAPPGATSVAAVVPGAAVFRTGSDGIVWMW